MAKNYPLNTAVLWGCRLLLGGAFAFAATKKIVDPATFATDIAHYRLLPHPLALVLGLYLPWLELICAAGVLCRCHERGALLLIAVLCAIFCTALASAWVRGLDINCGCFGHGNTPSSLPLAIARCSALGCIALILLRRSKRSACRAAGSGT